MVVGKGVYGKILFDGCLTTTCLLQPVEIQLSAELREKDSEKTKHHQSSFFIKPNAMPYPLVGPKFDLLSYDEVTKANLTVYYGMETIYSAELPFGK